jgi:hypothetical protein
MQALFQIIVFIDFYFKSEAENGIFRVFTMTIKHLATVGQANVVAIYMILKLFFDNLDAPILRTPGFCIVTAYRFFRALAHRTQAAARNAAGTQSIEHRFGT